MHGPPSASDLFRTNGTHAPSHPERSNRARIATLRAWRTVSVRSRAAAAEGYGLHAIPRLHFAQEEQSYMSLTEAQSSLEGTSVQVARADPGVRPAASSG